VNFSQVKQILILIFLYSSGPVAGLTDSEFDISLVRRFFKSLVELSLV